MVAENRDSAGGGVAARRRKVAMAARWEIETPSDQDSGGVPSNGLRTGTVVAENRDSTGGGVAARRRKVAISARWKGRLISMAAA